MAWSKLFDWLPTTRLVTRTKESTECASVLVENEDREMKVISTIKPY